MSSRSEPLHRPDLPSTEPDTAAPPVRTPSRRKAKQPAGSPASGGPRDVILVGCGALAQHAFVPALRSLHQAGKIAVQAVVDSDVGARDRCRRDFPLALPSPSLDAVVVPPDGLAIIATPARFHAAQSNAALKRGWHVLCASPLAITPREAAQMITTAQQQERILAVDLPSRFSPAAAYLRTLCRDHLLGPPVSFRIHDGMPPPAYADDAPIAAKFESPDGVLPDVGVRPLDLLTWWLGHGTVRHYADDAMGGVEANAFIDLSFAEGATGTVHLSRDWPTEQSYTFVFERGIVGWNAGGPGRLTLQLASAPSALQGELTTPLSRRDSRPGESLLATTEEAQIAELEHVLAAVARRESLRVSGTEAIPSLQLVEECYARRRPLPQPWLTQAEAVQARALAPPAALRRP